MALIMKKVVVIVMIMVVIIMKTMVAIIVMVMTGPLLFFRHDIDMIWIRFPVIVAVLQIYIILEDNKSITLMNENKND